jgi:hypothetical protein
LVPSDAGAGVSGSVPFPSLTPPMVVAVTGGTPALTHLLAADLTLDGVRDLVFAAGGQVGWVPCGAGAGCPASPPLDLWTPPSGSDPIMHLQLVDGERGLGLLPDPELLSLPSSLRVWGGGKHLELENAQGSHWLCCSWLTSFFFSTSSPQLSAPLLLFPNLKPPSPPPPHPLRLLTSRSGC